MKYIDAEKLIAEIERLKEPYHLYLSDFENGCREGRDNALDDILFFISLQQDQPTEGKQVVIITETDGDANIHWDCRSLDDVKALLASAQSFIADKQVEESRGIGSGPDYNTTEGRFRNAYKFHQEQPEVDLKEEITPSLVENMLYELGVQSIEDIDGETLAELARHFYELGLNARKK